MAKLAAILIRERITKAQTNRLVCAFVARKQPSQVVFVRWPIWDLGNSQGVLRSQGLHNLLTQVYIFGKKVMDDV